MANPASIKGKGFDANPQNINRKGQPKKGIALCNDKLKEEGYGPASKQDIEANYMSLINVDEAKLKQLVADVTQPMLTRVVAGNILGKKGFDVIERMLDRAHGKATQREEVKHSVSEGADILLKIQRGEINRDNAYEFLRMSREKNQKR